MAYEETFHGVVFSKDENEFESCIFRNCTFTDVSDVTFEQCTFEQCNLSNAKIRNTAFRNCTFRDCKLSGLNFSTARTFGFEIQLHHCNAAFVSFDRVNLGSSRFQQTNFQEANFTESNCSQSSFSECDFTQALFQGTNLSGLDLSSNLGLVIDPTLNQVRGCSFSASSIDAILIPLGIRLV